MKKTYIIIAIIIGLLLIAGGGYYIHQQQEKKYTNTQDPKLTNDELSSIDGKIKELENSIESKKNSATKEDLFKLQMELATQYRLRGRLLDARNELREAMKTLPDNISPWTELYVVENERGDYAAAEEALKKSLEINAANAQAWRWYIELKRDKLNASEAELRDLFREALDKTSQHVDIITIYAQFLEQHNDLPGAVQQWKIAIQQNPAGKAIYEAEIARIQEKLR